MDLRPASGETITCSNTRVIGDADDVKIVGHGNFVHITATVIGDNNSVFADGCRVYGSRNVVVGSGCRVEGHKNTIMGPWTRLFGDSNTIESDNNLVVGNHNVLHGDTNLVAGDHNTVVAGLHCQLRGSDNESHDPLQIVTTFTVPPTFGAVPSDFDVPAKRFYGTVPSPSIDTHYEVSPCIICTDNSPAIRFDPCGHTKLCGECFRQLPTRECPVCRGHIAGWQRVIL